MTASHLQAVKPRCVCPESSDPFSAHGRTNLLLELSKFAKNLMQALSKLQLSKACYILYVRQESKQCSSCNTRVSTEPCASETKSTTPTDGCISDGMSIQFRRKSREGRGGEVGREKKEEQIFRESGSQEQREIEVK